MSHRQPIEKCCPVCGKYYMDQSANYSKYACGLACRTEYYYAINPDKYFDRKINMRINVLKHQGVIISEDELREIKEKLKKGTCDICGKTYPINRLDIDHDHKTNKYRGVLCDVCNRNLGLVYENETILRSMIGYLQIKVTAPHT